MHGRGCARSQVDSKKELEGALKAGCEAFIMAATKLTVDDMLSFITKVTAVKVASSSKPLRQQVSPPRLLPPPLIPTHSTHLSRAVRLADCSPVADLRHPETDVCAEAIELCKS